jgi:type VI secretion system protein ImpM
MNVEMQSGLYGKLPAYGDFIFRNLNASFINPWDEWLQHFISGSKEQIGEDWLNIYLTSPIWRFVLSPGVIDQHTWAGLIMPSVDRVGRYFPISIVKPLSDKASPVNIIINQQAWFQQVEDHCLEALEGRVDADELILLLESTDLHQQDAYQPTGHLGETGSQIFGLTRDDDTALDLLMPYWLNASLTSTFSSFSIWQTAGSELISPMLFCSQGLPPIGGIASMLDGQWQKRNWKIPYNLNFEAEN